MLTVLAAAAAFAWTLHADLQRLYGMTSSAWDLAYDQQVIWNVSVGQGFYSSFARADFLGIHFELIFVVLAAVEKFWASPVVLLIFSSAGLAATAPAAYLFFRAILPTDRAESQWLAVALALPIPFWFSIQEAARDFAPRITLEEIARRAKEGEVKELSLVVKADAQGTLEAVLSALQKIEDPVVAIKIVGQGVGAVTDSDLLLAGVSNAIIVCFNLKATPAATAAAERAKVEVRYYDVIYKLTEDVERAAKGLREPTFRQIREGRVEVVIAIKIPRQGVIAGSRVVEGKVSRGGWVKLFRGKEQIFEGKVSSLKHFKEDAREMSAGQECGVGLEGFEAFEPGDVMETYRLEREEI